MTTICVLWWLGHFKLCRCQQSAQVWKHRRYSSFITSIWESLLLTSFFTSPKRSIIWNLKALGCKDSHEGLDGDRVTNARLPHIEIGGQKSRAIYAIHSIYPVTSQLYTTYKHFLQSFLNSMKGEVSSRRFSSRQLIIAHQDETGLQTVMQNVWNIISS